MKIGYKIFAIFILLMSLCLIKTAIGDASTSYIAPDIAAIQKRGALRLAVYAANPNDPGPKGNYGNDVEVDLATMIAQQLDVKLTIIPAPSYDAIIDFIAENKADLGAELAILPERALRVNFTNAYYSYHPQFLVNRLKSAKLGWNTPQEVIAGMKQGGSNITIGALQNSASINIIQINFPNAKIVPYNNPEQSFQDVISGKIYATMGSDPLDVQTFLNKNPKAGLRAEEVDLKSATLLVAMALPWQDFHLREWLNNYLSVLQANGITNQVFNKYGYSAQ